MKAPMDIIAKLIPFTRHEASCPQFPHATNHVTDWRTRVHAYGSATALPPCTCGLARVFAEVDAFEDAASQREGG